jgi:hypothetical protein
VLFVGMDVETFWLFLVLLVVNYCLLANLTLLVVRASPRMVSLETDGQEESDAVDGRWEGGYWGGRAAWFINLAGQDVFSQAMFVSVISWNEVRWKTVIVWKGRKGWERRFFVLSENGAKVARCSTTHEFKTTGPIPFTCLHYHSTLRLPMQYLGYTKYVSIQKGLQKAQKKKEKKQKRGES